MGTKMGWMSTQTEWSRQKSSVPHKYRRDECVVANLTLSSISQFKKKRKKEQLWCNVSIYLSHMHTSCGSLGANGLKTAGLLPIGFICICIFIRRWPSYATHFPGRAPLDSLPGLILYSFINATEARISSINYRQLFIYKWCHFLTNAEDKPVYNELLIKKNKTKRWWTLFWDGRFFIASYVMLFLKEFSKPFYVFSQCFTWWLGL